MSATRAFTRSTTLGDANSLKYWAGPTRSLPTVAAMNTARRWVRLVPFAGVLTLMRLVLIGLACAGLAIAPASAFQTTPATQPSPAGAITGVVRSATGQPIAGAAVTINPGLARQMTDERGRFAFV